MRYSLEVFKKLSAVPVRALASGIVLPIPNSPNSNRPLSLVLCGALWLSGLNAGATLAADTQTPGAPLNLTLPIELTAKVDDPAIKRVSMKAFAAMISSSDEMVRAQRLEESIADEGVSGAQGIFEPFMFMAIEREGSNVLTTAQDAQRLGVLPRDVFSSRESRLKTGVTLKAITGADVELSYNVSSLKDSVQPSKTPLTSPEYKGYLGAKITQPLWRGAGSRATKAGIEIAESEKGVATETIRQLTAQRVMEGVQTYIFVQRAEERVRLRLIAVGAAGENEREIARQNAVGLRSALEHTEARSLHALRRAQLAQAEQDLGEQHNLLQVFVSGGEQEANAPLTVAQLRPGDLLEVQSAPILMIKKSEAGFTEQLDEVMSRRPEALVNAKRIGRETRKLEQAQDQAKPELNLVVRGGKEDLASSRRPLDDYMSSAVPYASWFAGMTFKIGMFGDEKRSSEFRAAAYRRDQAQLALGAVRQRITNEVLASGALLDKAVQQAARQHEIVEAQRALLKAERELVVEGRRSSLDVLKKQGELLLAEEALGDAVAQLNRASYLSSQVDGSLLKRLGLE